MNAYVTLPKSYYQINQTQRKQVINRSFLDSITGLTIHDAEEIVVEAGFHPMIIENGSEHLTTPAGMVNVINLWKSKDGHTVSCASCNDVSQLLEDI